MMVDSVMVMPRSKSTRFTSSLTQAVAIRAEAKPVSLRRESNFPVLGEVSNKSINVDDDRPSPSPWITTTKP